MTLKDLHGAVGVWKDIEETKKKIEQAEAAKSKITASYSLAPGGAGDGQRLAKAIETIYQYELELVDKYTELFQKKLDIQRFLRSVDDPIIRLALQLKYDPEKELLSWLQVAVRIYGAGASADSIRMACKRYVESL